MFTFSNDGKGNEKGGGRINIMYRAAVYNSSKFSHRTITKALIKYARVIIIAIRKITADKMFLKLLKLKGSSNPTMMRIIGIAALATKEKASKIATPAGLFAITVLAPVIDKAMPNNMLTGSGDLAKFFK